MTRAGCYTLDSAHVMLHFVRKERNVKRPRRSVAALVESLHQAETEERESLDRELLRSATRPR